MPWIALEQDDGDFVERLRERKTRFRADHNLNKRIVRALREAGYDIVVSSVGALQSASDGEHHEKAFRENRMFVTHDKDLLEEWRHPRDNTNGCVVLAGGGGNEPEVSAAIEFMVTIVGPYRRLWRSALVRLHRSGIFELRDVNAESGVRETTYYRIDLGATYVWGGGAMPEGRDRGP